MKHEREFDRSDAVAERPARVSGSFGKGLLVAIPVALVVWSLILWLA